MKDTRKIIEDAIRITTQDNNWNVYEDGSPRYGAHFLFKNTRTGQTVAFKVPGSDLAASVGDVNG